MMVSPHPHARVAASARCDIAAAMGPSAAGGPQGRGDAVQGGVAGSPAGAVPQSSTVRVVTRGDACWLPGALLQLRRPAYRVTLVLSKLA
jgi:hypothetical protein